ncbi:phage tail tube protein [Tianweitania sp.]|uniref:phage tail tube protein n=1 Tax=Tianweitania sp. TaxID=2021634 RepID=UPI0028A2A3D7|nr:phage tail tube protein [Tianweitania sp.]
MGIAAASSTRLAYVAETAPGVIPATPTFKTARYTSETIRLAKQTMQSDEITGNRNVTDIADVGRAVEGAINTEISYGTFDEWLAGLLAGDWNNDVLKNGNVDKTFAFEKTFATGAPGTFTRYRGCRFNTLDLTLAARQKVTGSWGIMGVGSPNPGIAIFDGATYGAQTTTPILNAATNVANLAVGGVPSPVKVNALSIRVTNNLYANEVLGAYEVDSHGLGLFVVTGTMTAFFESKDLYQAVLDHTDVSLAFTIGAAANSKYKIELPRMKLTDGGPTVGGNARSVMLEVPFQALYSAADLATMKITRAVA